MSSPYEDENDFMRLQEAAIMLQMQNQILESVIMCLVSRLGTQVNITGDELRGISKLYSMDQTISRRDQQIDKVAMALRLR